MSPELSMTSHVEILKVLKDFQQLFHEQKVDLADLAATMRERCSRYDKQLADHQSDIDKLYFQVAETSAGINRLEGEIKSFNARFDRIDARQVSMSTKVAWLDKKMFGYLIVLTGIVMAIDHGVLNALVKLLVP